LEKLFEIGLKIVSERTPEDEQNLTDFLIKMEMFHDFPLTLVKEVTRKMSAQLLVKAQISKHLC
jgi:hypothetical protein